MVVGDTTKVGDIRGGGGDFWGEGDGTHKNR